jgi:predicted anti-sigma-YlaC factor YlaD
VTCKEVREQLAEHLLGTIEPAADAEVRRHLRGCTACRAEMSALADGVSTFSVAAHDVEPPDVLRPRVLAVLEEEWSDAPEAPRRRRFASLGRVAGIAAVAVALALGAVATIRAAAFEEDAGRYRAFVEALGGNDVRVGELRAAGTDELEGDVVIYESATGQSWVLVLVRAPGREGTANVTMLAGERRIDLHPMEFGPGGEASTWLVTSGDLTAFERVNLWDEAGLIASADVERS